jgi:glycosyltransferase involved in cell wall biosynthesis
MNCGFGISPSYNCVRVPRFSIVIPAYNREREVRRAVESCLAQDFTDYEVVVVDDGSTDRTGEVVESIGDTRVRQVRHSTNRGHGPARNTGVRAASGDWVVMLDSDEELLSGALSSMAQQIAADKSDVERHGFFCEYDNGVITLRPAPGKQLLDYESYLLWLDDREVCDFLACTKRVTFDQVRWEESRWAEHWQYHLDFAMRFRTMFYPITLARAYTDAGSRLGHERRDARIACKHAVELGGQVEKILKRHGDALQRSAPRTYEMCLRICASYHYIAGERRSGLSVVSRNLRFRPWSPELWAIVLLGMTSGRLLATVRSWRPLAT